MELTEKEMAQLALRWWKCCRSGDGLEDLIHGVVPRIYKDKEITNNYTEDEACSEVHNKVKEFLEKLSQ